MLTESPCYVYTDKVIIISSFTSALDMMHEFLSNKGVKSCRYQGDMNIAEREAAIRRLKKSVKCRVMLRAFHSVLSLVTPRLTANAHAFAVSLKCGGVGLYVAGLLVRWKTQANLALSSTLTRANRVIALGESLTSPACKRPASRD